MRACSSKSDAGVKVGGCISLDLARGMTERWQPYAISFSSGGVRVIGHMGVLSALLDTGVVTNVRAWYGCSGGSICAFMGVLGASAGWLRDFAEHFQLKILGLVSDDVLTSFVTTWGVNTGEEGMALLGRYLETWEPGCASWTFADLARVRPGVRLGISATNVTRGTLAWFSAETTPTMRILEAIRVSCSIPFFFTPWFGPDGDMYCDGAILEPYPWQHLSAGEREQTLVITCSESSVGGGRGVGRETPTSLSNYLGRLVHIMRPRPVEVPRHWIAVNNRKVSLIDFGLSLEGRIGLFEEGAAAGQRWLRWQEIVRRAVPQTGGSSQLSAGPSAERQSRLTSPSQSSDTPPPSAPTGSRPSPSHRRYASQQPSSRRRWSL